MNIKNNNNNKNIMDVVVVRAITAVSESQWCILHHDSLPCLHPFLTRLPLTKQKYKQIHRTCNAILNNTFPHMGNYFSYIFLTYSWTMYGCVLIQKKRCIFTCNSFIETLNRFRILRNFYCYYYFFPPKSKCLGLHKAEHILCTVPIENHHIPLK